MDDLFDVFNEAPKAPPPAANGGTDNSSNQQRRPKRQANGELKSATNGDVPSPAHSDSKANSSDAEMRDDEAGSGPKRPRMESEPEPVVADTFETQKSREVATSAG